MKKIMPRSGCPISCAMDFFGDKWTLLILRDIIFFDKHTYGDFLDSGEGIATNILADRLTTLEDYGFITKQVALDKKSKNIYKPTEKGVTVIPLLLEMANWGTQSFPSNKMKKIIEEYNSNRQETIDRLKENILKDN